MTTSLSIRTTPWARTTRSVFIGLMGAALLALSACAKDKPADDGIDRALTPTRAAADIGTSRGQRVRWGGVIINATNLKDSTQLEVLAYPLDRDGRPRREENPLGRFLAFKDGYLETVDYAPGRLITLTGPVQDTRIRKLGEADYTYPILLADDLRLWNNKAPREEPRFHFGIGVGVGL